MAIDNATPHAAREYEAEVKRTIPFHDELIATAIDVALAAHPAPRSWLDTGCGPGELASRALTEAAETRFWLSDPSAAMLGLARARLPMLPPDRFKPWRSEELEAAFGGPLEVITAVQCHHYGDMIARERAVSRCYSLLGAGGVLVVFENVRAETEAGHEVQRARWSSWLRRAGRDEAAIASHFDREGKAMFPVRVSEHLALFEWAGFEAELVWRAYGQAGFSCRKR
jgi:tRNA (cmo5U34)-methyltransferase